MNTNPLMNVNALTWEERSYLLGLYLADGNLHRQKKKKKKKGKPHRTVTEVRYSLQGNEQGIVDQVAMIFRRCCLKPRIYNDAAKYCITICASCTNLTEFFPDKETLLSDEVARRLFLEKSDLLSNLRNRVAFCAGLLDGDGACVLRADTSKTGRSGNLVCLSAHWSFSQTKYPFLIDFFRDVVDSLAPDSSGIIIRRRPRFTLWFKRAGREALLRAGVTRWSWKARTCMELLSELRGRRDRERAERTKRIIGGGMRLVDAAKKLDVPYSKLRCWHECGKLRVKFVPEGRGRGYFVVSRDEVETLEREKERKEKIEGEGVRLTDVGRMLGVQSGTLHKWRQHGVFRATRISDGRSYMVIPRSEVDELRKRLIEGKDWAKRISDMGVTFLDAARLLGIPRDTLYRWYGCGELLAKRVHAGFHKCLVIPRGEFERLKEEVLRERGRTDKARSEGVELTDVARMLGIRHKTLQSWYQRRVFEATLVCEGCRKYLVVPRGEVERLREETVEVERIERGGMKLVDASEMLGINSGTLRKWHQLGMLRATLVSSGHGRHLVIPKDEVERLKHELGRSDDC